MFQSNQQWRENHLKIFLFFPLKFVNVSWNNNVSQAFKATTCSTALPVAKNSCTLNQNFNLKNVSTNFSIFRFSNKSFKRRIFRFSTCKEQREVTGCCQTDFKSFYQQYIWLHLQGTSWKFGCSLLSFDKIQKTGKKWTEVLFRLTSCWGCFYLHREPAVRSLSLVSVITDMLFQEPKATPKLFSCRFQLIERFHEEFTDFIGALLKVIGWILVKLLKNFKFLSISSKNKIHRKLKCCRQICCWNIWSAELN